jgi:hypothetical protein
MGVNDRRRQKKLERRTAKRKERRRELAREAPQGLAEQLALAASGSVVHCCVQAALTEEGVGSLLISREGPRQQIGFAVLLVDAFCLGVKDALGNFVSRAEYETFYRQFSRRFPLIPLTPASGLRLVEDAVAYARQFGIEPHPDFHRVKGIFAGIDSAGASRRFEFGDRHGKPHFFAGPHDDPFRCRQVISLLRHHCGPDGFHFTIPFGEAMDLGLEYAEDDEEDEDDVDGFDDDSPTLGHHPR